eukprot:3726243-Rhodomonas_salina.1
MYTNDFVPMQAAGSYLEPPRCGAKRAVPDGCDDGASRQRRTLPVRAKRAVPDGCDDGASRQRRTLPVCAKRAADDARDDGAKRQMMFPAAAVQAPATMYMPNSLYTIEEECAPVSYKRTHDVMEAGGRNPERNPKRKQDEMLELHATFEPMAPRKHLVVDAMQLD